MAEVAGALFAFRAFGVDAPVAAAAAVVLLTTIALFVTLWPGNVGVVQIAIVLPLLGYGVRYVDGLLYGAGLQAVEILVALAVGIPCLALEGASLRGLNRRRRPDPAPGWELPVERDAARPGRGGDGDLTA